MFLSALRRIREVGQNSDVPHSVFGEDSGAVLAFRERADALQRSTRLDRQSRASCLCQLATSLAAVTETIEAENNDAARLRVLLDGIVKECEVIAPAARAAA